MSLHFIRLRVIKFGCTHISKITVQLIMCVQLQAYQALERSSWPDQLSFKITMKDICHILEIIRALLPWKEPINNKETNRLSTFWSLLNIVCLRPVLTCAAICSSHNAIKIQNRTFFHITGSNVTSDFHFFFHDFDMIHGPTKLSQVFCNMWPTFQNATIKDKIKNCISRVERVGGYGNIDKPKDVF